MSSWPKTSVLVRALFIGALVGNVTGNASTATALQTARAINGVNFNGTAPITVTAAAGTLTGATLNATVLASSLTSVGTLTSLADVIAVPAQRRVSALVRRYKLKADEEIDIESGVIRASAPKPADGAAQA
jgi:hypothetical protein